MSTTKVFMLSIILTVLAFSMVDKTTGRPQPSFPTIPKFPKLPTLAPSFPPLSLPTIPTPLLPGSLSPMPSSIPGLPRFNPPLSSVPGFPGFLGPPHAPPTHS
ncbi:hypothetical protein POM88_001977 [Heracleum sosnowskyi]|uniref:Uncharacterized protein n=1 Tax=Heracleum sosnowskyi TaxID=360622 RepID=A0AAD8GQD3_9APIA|nr:hypothetical protein POM88_053266 [Heracleum sosnowskyi]KAK1402372.1 hypothetical protein POM88_001977 [Heracleum sosnowskyi]